MNQFDSVEPPRAGDPWSAQDGDGQLKTETRRHIQSCEGRKGCCHESSRYFANHAGNSSQPNA